MTDEEILALAAEIKERRRLENIRLWTERFEAWCAAHPVGARIDAALKGDGE